MVFIILHIKKINMLALLLFLLTQVTVTSTGINVSDLDVSKIMGSLTSRTGSFFNVIIAFAGVIIVVWFIKLILKFIHKD